MDEGKRHSRLVSGDTRMAATIPGGSGHQSMASGLSAANPSQQDIATTLIDQQLPSPPPYTKHPISAQRARPLVKPIAIPRAGPGADAPFMRAWPATATTDLSEAEWIQFIDGLSVACQTSPAVKVVGMVEAGLAMVPNLLQTPPGKPYLQWASTGLGHAMTIGNHLYAKRTCDKYLKAANDRLFAPHGLTCRLFTTQALRLLLGVEQGEVTRLSTLMNTVGPIAMSLGMPKVDRAVHIVTQKASGKPTDTIERYKGRGVEPAQHALASMGDRLAGLRYTELPPPIIPAAWHDQATSMITTKPNVPIPDAHARKAEDKLEQKVLKEQKRRRDGKKPKKLGYKEENLALKSHWDLERTVWIVVMNADEDTKIDGAKQYDATENVRISEQEIEAELAREQRYHGDALPATEMSGTDTAGSESDVESTLSEGPSRMQGQKPLGTSAQAGESSGKKWWSQLGSIRK